MIISGGKVIAIDKVKRDNTLSGDGRFAPLGVIGFLSEKDAEKKFQPKGDYASNDSLKNYYTKTEVNDTFATIAGVYDKDSIDTKFLGLNSLYDANGAASEVKDWVSANYFDATTIQNTYYTKTEEDDTHGVIRQEVSEARTDFLDKMDEISETFAGEISDVYNAGYINVSSLQEAVPNKQYAIYWQGENNWSFQEVTGGEGGGTGPAEIKLSGQSGISVTYAPLTNIHWVGLEESYKAACEYVSEQSATWDSIADKQDALTEEELSAISSVSSISADVKALQDDFNDALNIVGGDDIEVKEEAGSVTVSYIGTKGTVVEFIDDATQAVNENTVYVVMKEIEE